MASFLLRILCCIGKRPRDRTISDEESRLIPTSTVDGEILTGNAPSPDARAAFDNEIFKERLGSIVRSKEGKMVSVTSPLPFNLHNKPRALIDVMTQGSFMSSSSRSASASTFHESQSPNPHPFYVPRPPPPRVRSNLRITPIHSASHSRSRTRSRSHSHSSAPSAMSSSKDISEEDEELPEGPPGVLGVRLVRGYDAGQVVIGRRGRAKVKKGSEEAEPVDVEPPEPNTGRDECKTGLEMDCDRLSTSLNGLPPEVEAQRLSSSPPPLPELSISPASDTFEFRLHDVGSLSASWGE